MTTMAESGKVKITVEIDGQIITENTKAAAVVSLDKNMIAGLCSAIDLLSLAAKLHMAIDTTVKMLVEDYDMSQEDVLSSIAWLKNQFKVKDQC